MIAPQSSTTTVAREALQAGDLVAVTGANGFVGCHVVAAALRHGLRVRAIVRDEDDIKKRAPILALLQQLAIDPGDRLSFASGDLLQPGSYDDAIAGCDGVAHVAAVARFTAPNPQRDIVDPSVLGVDNVYAAIAKAASVHRVAHTSSVAAIMRASDARKGHVFGDDDWNTESTLKNDAYGYAKALAERRAWAQVAAMDEATRPHLVVINPALVLGRVTDWSHVRSSPTILRDLIIGKFPACPAMHFGFVDAEDVAEAHIQALLQQGASGRYIVCAEQGWLRDLALRISALYPTYKVPTRRMPNFVLRIVARFDKRINNELLDLVLDNEVRYDASRSRDDLGIRYAALDDSIVRTVNSLVAGGWAKPKLKR